VVIVDTAIAEPTMARVVTLAINFLIFMVYYPPINFFHLDYNSF
jgi:hypothetical protein